MNLIEDAGIDATGQWFRNVQNDCTKGVDFAHQWLDSITVPDTSSAPAAATAATVSLVKFSGDPLRYYTFMNTFDALSKFSTTLDPGVIAVHRTLQL